MLGSDKSPETVDMSHPWNDLEQRFLEFTTTVKELAKAISVVVEDSRVPAEISDTVSNLAIGLTSYTTTCEDEIATAMEGKICHDYRIEALQQVTGVMVIGDDYSIQLPMHATQLLGWQPGDQLKWKITDDNTAIIWKLAE